MESGWSIKSLHRRILLSSTFQQASADRADARAIDPENSLYWRMNRRRLDFEATRDSLLAVSGQLDQAIGGPPIPSLTATSTKRRTLYGFLDRLNLPGLYRTFDFPDPMTSSPRRDQTTVAPQALFLMNHRVVTDAARALVARPEIARTSVSSIKVERLFHLLYNRAPSGEDIASIREFLAGQPLESTSWSALAQALFMTNEFVFID
jgi:hypothetical protein